MVGGELKKRNDNLRVPAVLLRRQTTGFRVGNVVANPAMRLSVKGKMFWIT